jgi:F-type H+-transporting ATPase subunit delta
MPVSPVARRYAQALVEVAAEANAVDPIANDLHRVVGLLDANEGQLRAALCSPVFTAEERSSVLAAVLPRLSLHPLAANLLRLINDNGRFAVMPDIAEAYLQLADERAGRQQVEVTTAEPMTPQVEAEVRAALQKATGKTVRLSTKVDPSLLGGLVAKVGGTVYDSSIRTRLEQLKHNLIAQEVAVA